MTNIEKEKCEKLCEEALREIKEADVLYKEAEEIDKEFHKATVQLRRADNKRGFAEGINQVLATLGYRSNNMQELNKLI